TTHTLVGGVIGVGFGHGIAALNLTTVRRIVTSWVATVPVAAVVAAVLFVIARAVVLCAYRGRAPPPPTPDGGGAPSRAGHERRWEPLRERRRQGRRAPVESPDHTGPARDGWTDVRSAPYEGGRRSTLQRPPFATRREIRARLRTGSRR